MLTPRQKEIAGYVARGCTATEIARVTRLHPRTVRTHIEQAAERLPGEGPPRHRLTLYVLRMGDRAA